MERVLGDEWRLAAYANKLTALETETISAQMQLAFEKSHRGIVALHYVDGTDVAACAGAGAQCLYCACAETARLYATTHHVVRHSKTHFIIEWLAEENVETTVAFSEIETRDGARAQPILVAVRSTVRCGAPSSPTKHDAAAPSLGHAWARLCARLCALDEARRARMRAHVVAHLRAGRVAPLRLTALDAGDVRACARPGACALCTQGAFLFAAAAPLHVLPYTRAHTLCEWLVNDEHVRVDVVPEASAAVTYGSAPTRRAVTAAAGTACGAALLGAAASADVDDADVEALGDAAPYALYVCGAA
jgi:hypothetical protein